jgi:hypothetical protein
MGQKLQWLAERGWKSDDANRMLVAPWSQRNGKAIVGERKFATIDEAIEAQSAFEQMHLERAVEAAEGDGYVQPLTVPDTVPEGWQ